MTFLTSIGSKLWPYAEPFFRKCKACAVVLFFALLGFMIAILLTGCSMGSMLVDSFKPAYQTQGEGPLYKYKADLQITIGGSTFDGMAVTKLSGPIQFSLVSKARLDLLTISSCHRHVTFEKIDKNWFGGVGKKFTYTYSPTSRELEGLCPLYIQAFDRNGVTAWGYIAFRSKENLPTKTDCNGTTWSFSGFTVCQSKAGFIQVERFAEPIKYVEADPSCKLKQISETEFELRPELGFCHVTYSNGTEFHRSTFLGYDSAFVRGE